MSNGFQLIEGQVIGNDSVAAPAVGDIPIARFDQPVVLLAELKDGFEKLVVGLFKCAEDVVKMWHWFSKYICDFKNNVFARYFLLSII